jgi:hypothetical protein
MNETNIIIYFHKWFSKFFISSLKSGCYSLAGGTFFMLNTKKVWALFQKLSASKRESEEYGLKENSCTVEIDPLKRKF